jgi:membrane protein
MRRAQNASGLMLRFLRECRPVALFHIARKAVYAALSHDCLTLAQATAYSAMVALFPALIVAAAVVALLPDTLPLRFQMAIFFDRILPSNVSPLLDTYFATSSKNPQTARALIGCVIVSATGAAGIMATLMESFRRAHHLPLSAAGFWRRRGRALLLVPLSLLPMCAASALVVFGHFLTHWAASHFGVDARMPFYVLSVVLRWSVAFGGSIGIIAVIYHLGTDVTKHMREHVQPFLAFHMDWSWRSSLPGATLATAMWFLTTLIFGLYVTRYANYSQVYGSLGAAIALMFWLYIIALSVICGAEFNAQLAAARRRHSPAEEPPEPPEVP